MKILLISEMPPSPGGIARWTERYLDWCKKSNIYVDIVNTGLIGKRLSNYTKIYYLEEIKRNLKIIKNEYTLLNKQNYDIVHLNTPCSTKGMIRDVILVKKAKKKGCKVIIHCHCNIEDWVNNRLARFLYKKLVKNSNKVITLNSKSAAFVKNNFSEESIIIPNFIEKNEVSKCVINEEIKKVLFVGILLNTKGIREINEVAKDFPNISFDLVGNITDDSNGLVKSKNVKICGPKSKIEVLEEMKNHDVFLFPSYTEGFPNVILEAMSVGLPIISTGVGAISDMLSDDVGKIIPIKDTQVIVDALIELQDVKVRNEMSQKSIEKINKEYDINIVMPKIIDAYNNILR